MKRVICDARFRCDTCGEEWCFDDMAYVGLIGEGFKEWKQECRRCSNERMGLPDDLVANNAGETNDGR